MMVLNAEPSTAHRLPSHVYTSLTEATAALRHLVDCCAAPADPRAGAYVLALELAASGRLLGHVGFSPLSDEVELSCAVAVSERTKGYGVTAVVAACPWLATQFGVDHVLALTSSGNIPSRRLLERTGFVHLHDEMRRFQGGPEQQVSHHRRQDAPGGGRPT